MHEGEVEAEHTEKQVMKHKRIKAEIRKIHIRLPIALPKQVMDSTNKKVYNRRREKSVPE